MARIPVAAGIFTWPSDEPQLDRQPLRGVRNRHLPRPGLVPALRRRPRWRSIRWRGAGRLWAWTTQEFPPPSPPYTGPTGDDFVPYGVGYVELGDEVRVETRLTRRRG